MSVKTWTFIYDAEFYSILFAFIFCFMLVFSLFKNMSWVEFLVGMFVVLLIPILSGIFMAIMRWEEEAVYLTFWGLFATLIVLGIVEKQKNIRRKRGALLLMIPHLGMAFLPIAILLTLDNVYNFWEWSYFDKYLIPSPTTHQPDRMIYNFEYRHIKSVSTGAVMLLGYISYVFIFYPLWIKIDWLRFIAKPKKS
jgi:hypothetical protein